MNPSEIDDLIKESIRESLKISANIKPSNTLVLSLYYILHAFYVENKNHVICELPTGSGKSVIGYLTHYCTSYIEKKLFNQEEPSKSYFLTSSKMLQEQIERDFDRFNIKDDFKMLKGTSNYECVFWKVQAETETNNLEKLGMKGIINNKKEVKKAEEEKVTYDKRFCLGLRSEDKKSLECYSKCPYIICREETSRANCAVFNYAYFLNVMRSDFNPFFGERNLTIADEAHLIPDIVCGMFSIEIGKMMISRLKKLVGAINNEYTKPNPTTNKVPFITSDSFRGDEENSRQALNECISIIYKCENFFNKSCRDINEVIEYYKNIESIIENINFISAKADNVFRKLFDKSYVKIIENEDNSISFNLQYLEDLALRPEDVFIESEIRYGTNYYVHKVRDLRETELVKKFFKSNVDKCLYMSATLGNIDQYANMMGLEKDEYSGFRMDSTFDFSNSPIYLCNSGYLNYKSFDLNIDSVLNACINICEKIHPNESGIIHTSTFKITEMLMEKISSFSSKINLSRYLFYKTPEQKEEVIKRMKSEKGLILVGPSLYEGLDLPGDEGRFNILIKVPYPGIDKYIKAKMERIPFWYDRVTLEKMVQAIGRTNRFVCDWSIVYLLDSLFERQIFKVQNSFITNRVRFKTIDKTPLVEKKVMTKNPEYEKIAMTPLKPQQSTDWDDIDDLPF